MVRKLSIGLCLVLSGVLLYPKVFSAAEDPRTPIKSYTVQGSLSRATDDDMADLFLPFSKSIELDSIVPEEPSSMEPDITPVTPLARPAIRYSHLVLPLSDKYGVDWRLIAAVMQTESNFNPHAISDKGAIGLMQVMPSTAALYRIRAEDLYDPAKNIEAGVQHLKMLTERYDGNLELVIAAYNSGEGAVDRYHGIPPYRHTRSFVHQVLSRYNAF